MRVCEKLIIPAKTKLRSMFFRYGKSSVVEQPVEVNLTALRGESGLGKQLMVVCS